MIVKTGARLYQVVLIASIAWLVISILLFTSKIINMTWLCISASVFIAVVSFPFCVLLCMFMMTNAGVFVGPTHTRV